jgi:VanZ family protein
MNKVKTVLSAAVTYIVIAQAILVILADEIGQLFADGQAATVVQVIVRVGAVLTAAVSIIRRVTPVLPSERGLT